MSRLRKASWIALIALAIIGSVLAVSYYCNIQHVGEIQTIGVKVYASDGQTVLTQLDWGDVFRGNTYYRYAFLKSESSVNTTVQYSVDDLPSYLDFNLYYQTGYWNGSIWVPTGNWTDMATNPYMLQPEEWLRLKFELVVDENATLGAFSFTVIISATS